VQHGRGKATLGPIGGTDYPALFSGLSGEAFGLLAGAAFMMIAWLLPRRIGGARRQPVAAE